MLVRASQVVEGQERGLELLPRFLLWVVAVELVLQEELQGLLHQAGRCHSLSM
jgi:hypothetical protein